MREGWEIKTLGEVCDISAGQGAPQGEENYCLDGTPFIKAGNLEALVNGEGEQSVQKVSKEVALSHRLVLQKKGSIVFAKSGMSCMKGYIYTLQQDCYVVSHLAVLFPQSVYGPYLNYALHFFKPSSLASDASFPSITLKDLALFPVPFPVSLQEQQRIVDILDQEFAKIVALKANAEKSLQAAKDLFQATLKKELEPKEGWETSSLSSIGKTATGTTPSTSNKENYGSFIPFIKPADVNVDGKGALCYDNEGLSDIGASRGRVFPENSILMVCIGASIGKVGYSLRPVSSNQQINILSPGKEFYWKYIYYCMASGDFQQKVIKEGESAKATLPIINKSKWERLTISSPGITEQERIASRLDDLNNKCQALQDNYQKTLALCDDLKQSLLRKAFNGEL